MVTLITFKNVLFAGHISKDKTSKQCLKLIYRISPPYYLTCLGLRPIFAIDKLESPISIHCSKVIERVVIFPLTYHRFYTNCYIDQPLAEVSRFYYVT